MNTQEIIARISKQTGIPESKVSAVIADYCRDSANVINNCYSGGFNIPNIGFLFYRNFMALNVMDSILKNLKYKIRPHKFVYQRYREIVTDKIDKFYGIANIIMENQNIKNENYQRGAGKKYEYDMDRFKELMDGMENFLLSIEFPFARSKYLPIQKIHLRNLLKQGILQAVPEKLDCQVQPMRVCD